MPHTQTRLLNTKEAAKYLGLAKNTLEKYRSIGNVGPKYLRVGRRKILYRISDLEEFLFQHVYTATCEYA